MNRLPSHAGATPTVRKDDDRPIRAERLSAAQKQRAALRALWILPLLVGCRHHELGGSQARWATPAERDQILTALRSLAAAWRHADCDLGCRCGDWWVDSGPDPYSGAGVGVVGGVGDADGCAGSGSSHQAADEYGVVGDARGYYGALSGDD